MSNKTLYNQYLKTAVLCAYDKWAEITSFPKEQVVVCRSWLLTTVKEMSTKELAVALAEGEVLGTWFWLFHSDSPLSSSTSLQPCS